eukprot:3292616-Rhodomonas_salina.1
MPVQFVPGTRALVFDFGAQQRETTSQQSPVRACTRRYHRAGARYNSKKRHALKRGGHAKPLFSSRQKCNGSACGFGKLTWRYSPAL